jgi:hypothetical protein
MMRITVWWPKLEPASREWLIAHPDDEVPAEIMGEIVFSGEGWATALGWTGPGDSTETGFYMPPEAREWIAEHH